MTALSQLLDYLKRADDAYYNSSAPIISDDTYDAMVELLRRIDPNNEYLNKVGTRVKSNKIGRGVPMGTLVKYHEEEDILKWLELEKSNGDSQILVCPKYDGFAIELVYSRGKLVSAGTRGDGLVGEDILESVKNISNIPQILDDTDIIVRGEAIIPKSAHDDIRDLGYSAMRNAVPGIVRSNRVDALKFVKFIAYEFISDNGVGQCRSVEREIWKNKFDIEDYTIVRVNDIDKISEIRDHVHQEDYPYETDGIVLKTDIIKEDDLSHPTHMIAWKYQSNVRETILRGIEFQLGVTGFFTPIGIFDEVEFQGAHLSKASLGNMTRLAKEFKGITLGSIIEVSRRGDIIPYIEQLVLLGEGTPINTLKVCPHCGHPLVYYDLEPRCENEKCPELLRLRITSYVKSIGVKGIGDSLVKSLIDKELLTSIPSIYEINPEVILDIPRQGPSAVEKWGALQDKKLSALDVLSFYPFLNLGKKVWESVLKEFSYSQIMILSREDLERVGIKGLGSTKIDSIISQLELYKDDLIYLGNKYQLL